MKFTYLIRRKRKRLVNENKGFKGNGESASPWLGLTKLKDDAKMKKNKLVYSIDQAGNIEKIPTYKVKQKAKYQQKILDISNFGIGYYIVAPIILGVFLGLGLDSWFETKPYFFIFFLIFGTASSFYNIFKLLKDERKSTH